jgi:alanyl-tRNA synthetase
LSALRAVQASERLLWKVSETLNAPIEKSDKTAEKVVKELKEANTERRKLIKELAEKESTGMTGKSAEEFEEINGVKLVKRDFKEEIDVNRMVQTANEIIKRDESTVALFYGSDGKNARIMVMAGKKAVEKGANAGEIVREAAAIVDGGGGGKPNFAQGGGTQTSRLQEAIKKAEENLKKQLNIRV